MTEQWCGWIRKSGSLLVSGEYSMLAVSTYARTQYEVFFRDESLGVFSTQTECRERVGKHQEIQRLRNQEYEVFG